ncbi:DNA-binding response regulator [Clostridia bacterium]|nr:DNA-binding response regulator [Clostridia bacterium]
MKDILIIEDDIEIGTLLQDFLIKGGYSVYHATSGEEGLEYLESKVVRLVLLDIMLPKIDGFVVCKKIHDEKNLPLIILSAKSEKDDKLNGLLLGADDYIEKPYDIDILLAKINAIYRRHYDSSNKILTAGNIKIDTDARLAYNKEKLINLKAKEYDLLLFMIENKGKALRKETIFNRVWGNDSLSEPSTLTVHIKWLREKIEEDSKNPKCISTVWGVGYVFN